MKLQTNEDVLAWRWCSVEAHEHYNKGDFKVKWTPCGLNQKKMLPRFFLKDTFVAKKGEFYLEK